MVHVGVDRISRAGFYGTRGLDITVKTAAPIGRVFAPTWQIVMDFKNGRMDWDAYKAAYISLMRDSYRKHRDVWERVLFTDEVVFLCYCPRPERCHRGILQDLFVKMGARRI